jgi:TusA-related sulfurtransferase
MKDGRETAERGCRPVEIDSRYQRSVSIMRHSSAGAVAVDVRDMLCAQALAVVDRALGRLRPGECAAVRYDAEDVERDLIAWVRDRGHRVRDRSAHTLLIERA